MTILLTSTPAPAGQQITDYVDNFIFSVLTQVDVALSKTPAKRYRYDTFYQDGSEPEFDENTNDFEFHYYSVATITEAISGIVELVSKYQRIMDERPDDRREEINLIIACDKHWSRAVAKSIQDEIDEVEDFTHYPNIMNLYGYMKLTNRDSLVDIITRTLNCKFVYPDDPVAFGYALYLTLSHYI